MKQNRLLLLGAALLTMLAGMLGSTLCATVAHAQTKAPKAGAGKLAGVVLDTSGTPQMGATVELSAESSGLTVARELLTNTQGIFGEQLAAGLYTVRVTLAGFLPTLEKHVRINPNITTVLRLEMESLFASLDQLRRQPVNIPVEGDDWKWVLRSAAATRPVLEWMGDTEIVSTGSQYGSR